MIQTDYSRGINKSNLVLTADHSFETEYDSIEMFRYNRIPCFLSMQTISKDCGLQFLYDITGKRSLEQTLEYKLLDGLLLQRILNAFDQACIQAECYMLTEQDIMLSPQYVFLESEDGQVCYCYLPGLSRDICQQFQEFMEYLLQHLDHKDEQAVQLAYGVYQRVAEDKAALHKILDGINRGTAGLYLAGSVGENRKAGLSEEAYAVQTGGIRKQEIEQTGLQKQNFQPEGQRQPKLLKPDIQPEQPVRQEQPGQVKLPQQLEQKVPLAKPGQPKVPKQKTQAAKQKKEVQKKQTSEKLKSLLKKKLYTDDYRNQEEEMIFEADAEEELHVNIPTVCLMPESEGILNRFVYQGADRGRDFQCTEGNTILGSSAEDCSICIPVPMVSRVHARVEVSGQGTYIEDMNSTNGTQVNGELLKYREKYMLQKGDIVAFAGESYSFH